MSEEDRLRAEVDMLRGVGCGEDGDGPCGACIKCALNGKHVRQRTVLMVGQPKYEHSKGCLNESECAAVGCKMLEPPCVFNGCTLDHAGEYPLCPEHLSALIMAEPTKPQTRGERLVETMRRLGVDGEDPPMTMRPRTWDDVGGRPINPDVVAAAAQEPKISNWIGTTEATEAELLDAREYLDATAGDLPDDWTETVTVLLAEYRRELLVQSQERSEIKARTPELEAALRKLRPYFGKLTPDPDQIGSSALDKAREAFDVVPDLLYPPKVKKAKS